MPLAIGVACVTLGSATAQAQETSRAAAKADTAPALEEVVVTARKREESIQSVPVAITALSGEALEAHGVQTLEDVRFIAPSLQISPSPFGSSIPSISIRGQRPIESILSLDPSIGIYFDDVVAERPHGTNAALFDLQSVQVLKGPQGTLFGRNTTGGAVLITPAKPSFEKLEGNVGAAFGNYSTYNFSGMLNLPVSDRIALRFAFQTHNHDGYTKNLYNGKRYDDADDQSYRAAITLKPIDNLVSTFTYQYFTEETHGNGIRLGAVNPNTAVFNGTFGSAAGATIQTGLRNTLNFLGTQDWHTVVNDMEPGEHVETNHFDNITNWDLGAVTLKNVVGYRTVRSFSAFDYDGTAVPLPSSIGSPVGTIGIFNSKNTMDAHQFTEEFQVLGKAFDDRLNWITGLYYFRERGHDLQTSYLAAVSTNDAMVENKSRSVFAQATYKLIEKLSLTVGGRETWDDRSIEQHSQVTAVTTGVTACRIFATATTRLSPCSRDNSFSDHAPTWGATLDYAFTPDVMVYLSRRHGYKSGGLQLRSYNFGAPLTFKPEFVDDWELGLKSTFDLAGMPLRVNAAIYHQDYKDIQRTVSVAAIPPAVGLSTLVYNAGQATIKGGELEVTFLPIRSLELTAFFNYTKPEYDSFQETTATGVNDLSGSHFSMIPKSTAGASFRYHLPLPESTKISISGDWYTQSEMEITDKNVINGVPVGEGKISGYSLANAFVDWNDVMGIPLDLRLYIKNLTDKNYASGGTSVYASVGFYDYILGAPRTYGAELKYRF